jgi:hypothetical protein
MSWAECTAAIIKAGGGKLTEGDVDRILTEIAKRAERNRNPRLSQAEKLKEAADRMGLEVQEAAMVLKRNEAMNAVKRAARRAFYDAAPSATLALEAKLVGVNTPFAGSRLSVAAQFDALRDNYIGGLALDMEAAGVLPLFRSGAIDDRWAAELFALNQPNGKVGVTGDKNAAKIAELIHKWQRVSIDGLNREGAWIRDYSGYITRTTHDADRIRRAGRDQWVNDLFTKEFDVDLERTFGDAQAAREALPGLWNDFATGNHQRFDGDDLGKLEDYALPGRNLANKASSTRIIHFKSAAGWLAYNKKYGSGSPRETIFSALDRAARWTALMREFGTNPRAAYEGDVKWLLEREKADSPDKYAKLEKRLQAMQNRFDNLDGTADMPVNRLAADITSGWMAVQRMAKLGTATVAALFGDMPTKAMELRYHGVNLAEAWTSPFTGWAKGRGVKGSEKRAVLDLLRAGIDGMTGRIAARFDRIDTPSGKLARIENMFFRLTGMTAITDRQRADSQFIMARHFGTQKIKAFHGLQDESQRMLKMFDIQDEDWNLLRGVDWKQVNGRDYLTPERARLIPDAKVEALLRRREVIGEDASPALIEREVGRYKEDLALKVHSLYADRGGYAVLEAGIRERAILLQGRQPGGPLGIGLRLFAQFKAFPVAMITRVWGREVYGGKGTWGAAGGVVQLIVSGIVFGYAAMTVRDLLKGRNPRDPLDPQTWIAAFLASGAGSLYADFAFGEWNRFGKSLVASIAGPTIGQLDDIAKIWGEGLRGGDAKPEAVRWLLNNTPFQNLWYTRAALDYLILYQMQEALSPGYLRRMEKRLKDQTGQTFWLKPSEATR